MAEWNYIDTHADTEFRSKFRYSFDIAIIPPFEAVRMGQWIEQSEGSGEFFFERIADQGSDFLRVYFTDERTALLVKLRFQ